MTSWAPDLAVSVTSCQGIGRGPMERLAQQPVFTSFTKDLNRTLIVPFHSADGPRNRWSGGLPN